MWVFGYGSLMWDGWEGDFGCVRKGIATLPGFRRDFVKASVRNWGSREAPGPTLALIADLHAECLGMAFCFDDVRRDPILEYLREREGSSFALESKEVRLSSGSIEIAAVAFTSNSGVTYLGDRTREERAKMARIAVGTRGACVDYVRGIRDKLLSLGINDPAVKSFIENIEGPDS